MPHIRGLFLLCVDLFVLFLLLKIPPFKNLALTPDLEEDSKSLGLLATLFLYWQRWWNSPDPLPLKADNIEKKDVSLGQKPEIILVIQCESFMDPAELPTLKNRPPLPTLKKAREHAWQSGKLHVNGFGAYTMRTEYGVLFGRDDTDLGFRQFDPFMTAKREITYALSARLQAYSYDTLFVHPHDMRFYNRDDIMPLAGFSRLIGLDYFSPPQKGQRYVDDVTLGQKLINFMDSCQKPTFIYTVTMENHGPWDADGEATPEGLLHSYVHHAENSDRMLGDLIDYFAKAKKSAILVFFGDHRPSIPTISVPCKDRHTPYVFLCFNEKGIIIRPNHHEEDMTPADLYRMIYQYSKAMPEGRSTTADQPQSTKEAFKAASDSVRAHL
ncbi:hypothetical protein ZMO02_08380 [Zymomonas mobilis subsp. pomaceae]|nr:hypothetical protein ZMO02_08380 [Zymomonas mobilis subsp. pomaceae]